jgi:hypothetical protein
VHKRAVAGVEGVPHACRLNGLHCQQPLNAAIGATETWADTSSPLGRVHGDGAECPGRPRDEIERLMAAARKGSGHRDVRRLSRAGRLAFSIIAGVRPVLEGIARRIAESRGRVKRAGIKRARVVVSVFAWHGRKWESSGARPPGIVAHVHRPLKKYVGKHPARFGAGQAIVSTCRMQRRRR